MIDCISVCRIFKNFKKKLKRVLYNAYLACSRDSRTNKPAPSPITKPSLSLSNGLDADSGVWLNLVERALALENPLKASGLMQASTPPASITSQSPLSINLDTSFNIRYKTNQTSHIFSENPASYHKRKFQYTKPKPFLMLTLDLDLRSLNRMNIFSFEFCSFLSSKANFLNLLFLFLLFFYVASWFPFNDNEYLNDILMVDTENEWN